MNIYICNTPIGFPRSEYGGMIVVIAKNKKQLGKIITDYYKPDNESYFDLSLSAKSCKELRLDPETHYEAGIVSEFLT